MSRCEGFPKAAIRGWSREKERIRHYQEYDSIVGHHIVTLSVDTLIVRELRLTEMLLSCVCYVTLQQPVPASTCYAGARSDYWCRAYCPALSTQRTMLLDFQLCYQSQEILTVYGLTGHHDGRLHAVLVVPVVSPAALIVLLRVRVYGHRIVVRWR